MKLTEAAGKMLSQAIATEEGPVLGVRASVDPGGCSGHHYRLSLASTVREGDVVSESRGIRMLVDPESALHLEGVTIDYIETAGRSGFTFLGAQMRACSCGVSFDTGSGRGVRDEVRRGGQGESER